MGYFNSWLLLCFDGVLAGIYTLRPTLQSHVTSPSEEKRYGSDHRSQPILKTDKKSLKNFLNRNIYLFILKKDLNFTPHHSHHLQPKIWRNWGCCMLLMLTTSFYSLISLSCINYLTLKRLHWSTLWQCFDIIFRDCRLIPNSDLVMASDWLSSKSSFLLALHWPPVPNVTWLWRWQPDHGEVYPYLITHLFGVTSAD